MPHVPAMDAPPAKEKSDSPIAGERRGLKIRDQLSIQHHEPSPEKLLLAMFGKEAKRDPATGLLVLPRPAFDHAGPRPG